MGNPHEYDPVAANAPDPSPLEEAVLGLLEDAGIDTSTSDAIMKLIQQAEQNKAERDYDRHQEHLMETGGGPTLQEQQIEAMKLKRGRA